MGQEVSISSRRRGDGLICRAELVQDAPFAAAIGACIVTSLVSTISPSDPDDNEGGGGSGGGALDSTDTRFALMGIISFIPYFNWMSWVFAWLDSGKQRYLVYAVVYLAPYLRTNLSLSPEESWLPIASILLCIIHVQLEASIRNGDIDGIQFFGRALKSFYPFSGPEDVEQESHREFPKKGKMKKGADLPSAKSIRDEFGRRGGPRRHKGDEHHLKEYSDADESDNQTY